VASGVNVKEIERSDAHGVGEHRCPELRSQTDEGLGAEREDRGQQVDDEVAVEGGKGDPGFEGARDRELARGRGTVKEDSCLVGDRLAELEGSSRRSAGRPGSLAEVS
jgi:hypothetical protein